MTAWGLRTATSPPPVRTCRRPHAPNAAEADIPPKHDDAHKIRRGHPSARSRAALEDRARLHEESRGKLRARSVPVVIGVWQHQPLYLRRPVVLTRGHFRARQPAADLIFAMP